eukprot:gene1017-569_t
MVSDSFHDTAANQQVRTFTREERHATGKGWCAGGKGGTGFKPKKKSQWVTLEEYNKIQGNDVERTEPVAEVGGTKSFSHDRWVDMINDAIDSVTNYRHADVSFARTIFNDYMEHEAANDPIDFNEYQLCSASFSKVHSMLDDNDKIDTEYCKLKLEFHDVEVGSVKQGEILKSLMVIRKAVQENKRLLLSSMMDLLAAVIGEICTRPSFKKIESAKQSAFGTQGGMGAKGVGRGDSDIHLRNIDTKTQMVESTRSETADNSSASGDESSNRLHSLSDAWSFDDSGADDHETIRRSTVSMFDWLSLVSVDRQLLGFATLQEARDLYLNESTLGWMNTQRLFQGLNLASSDEQRGITTKSETGKHLFMEALCLGVTLAHEYFHLLRDRVTDVASDEHFPFVAPVSVGITSASGHVCTAESLEILFATRIDTDDCELLIDLERVRKYGPQKYRRSPWKAELTVHNQKQLDESKSSTKVPEAQTINLCSESDSRQDASKPSKKSSVFPGNVPKSGRRVDASDVVATRLYARTVGGLEIWPGLFTRLDTSTTGVTTYKPFTAELDYHPWVIWIFTKVIRIDPKLHVCSFAQMLFPLEGLEFPEDSEIAPIVAEHQSIGPFTKDEDVMCDIVNMELPYTIRHRLFKNSLHRMALDHKQTPTRSDEIADTIFNLGECYAYVCIFHRMYFRKLMNETLKFLNDDANGDPNQILVALRS